MKAKHAINLHNGLTVAIVVGLMLVYQNFKWLPFAILGLFFSIVFVPHMLKKERSLSRYPTFADYQATTGMLPQMFGASTAVTTVPTGKPSVMQPHPHESRF